METWLWCLIPLKEVVLLMLTIHNDNEEDQNLAKSEINLFYNTTKGRVDVFRKLCYHKSVSRRTKTWPPRVLYGILDEAAVNPYVNAATNISNATG